MSFGGNRGRSVQNIDEIDVMLQQSGNFVLEKLGSRREYMQPVVIEYIVA
jgi:hypothetical protein